MRIYIDIGHPAHVHYFKNFIRLMSERGHEFCVSARDKEVVFKLLDSLNIKYFPRGRGGKGVIGKIMYLFKGDTIVYSTAKNFKPDLFLSFASPYGAHAAFLMGKPHIALDDTEAATFGRFFYKPFTETIINPASYKISFRRKQIRINSFMELCSLHPLYFNPDEKVLNEINVAGSERFALLRFVSWNANHDLGQSGFSMKDKLSLIKELEGRIRLFISSETELPAIFEKYRLNVSPEKIHDVMAFATLFVGEGATMASECAMLGVPSIYVNSITAGTLEEQEQYGLLSGFRNSEGVLEKAIELLDLPDLSATFAIRRQKMLNEKIDPTAFLVWFIENYPESREIMLKNPSFQDRFKQA